MKLREIKEILNAECLTDEACLDHEVEHAFGSDLMSDVLAFVDENTLLLTGLVNPQVIRTAEMMDIKQIVFVRGKRPADGTIRLAAANGIALLATREILFTSCGKLYEKGLRGVAIL